MVKGVGLLMLSVTVGCSAPDRLTFDRSIALPTSAVPEETADARAYVPVGAGGAIGAGGETFEDAGRPTPSSGGALGTGGLSGSGGRPLVTDAGSNPRTDPDAGTSNASLTEGVPGDPEILHAEHLTGSDGYKAMIWYDCILGGSAQTGAYLNLGGYLYACTPEYSCRSPYGYEKCTDCRVYPQRWCLGTAELSALYK
jgi:hypothetical protein